MCALETHLKRFHSNAPTMPRQWSGRSSWSMATTLAARPQGSQVRAHRNPTTQLLDCCLGALRTFKTRLRPPRTPASLAQLLALEISKVSFGVQKGPVLGFFMGDRHPIDWVPIDTGRLDLAATEKSSCTWANWECWGISRTLAQIRALLYSWSAR
jgi:hypothetical protein